MLAGAAQLEFRLADVAFAFVSPGLPFAPDWRVLPLAAFLSEGAKAAPPADCVRVVFHPGSVPDLSRIPVAHRTNRLMTWYRAGSRLWLRWEHPLRPETFWVAEIALDENHVEVFFPGKPANFAPASPEESGRHAPESQPTGTTERPALPSALLSHICRVLTVVFLAPRQGLLHHAAAAMFRGRVWLFPGASGQGKSTLSGLLARHPQFEVVGDDNVATRYWPAPPGGLGSYRAYGTPWPSTAGFAANTAAPPGGFFFSNTGRRTGLNRFPPGRPCTACCRPPTCSGGIRNG